MTGQEKVNDEKVWLPTARPYPNFKLGLRFVSEFRPSTLVEKNFQKQEAGHNFKFGKIKLLWYGGIYYLATSHVYLV